MNTSPRRVRRALILTGLAVVAASCTSDGAAPTSTVGTETPSVGTLPPVTTFAPTTPPPTTPGISLPPPVTTEAPVGLAAEVAELIEKAEEIRSLGFLAPPEIEVLDAASFAERVRPLMDAKEAADRAEAMTLVLRLIGLLDEDDHLTPLRRDLQEVPADAWYDTTTGELLVADNGAGLGPLARSNIMHEALHALTDQHFRWAEAREELLDAGADDQLRAFDALVEGDATYFQIVYVQQLPEAERLEIATEYAMPSSNAAASPEWLIEDLAFPFEAGFGFVEDLVAVGGIAAVDRAYLEPPTTSEQILHPERYRRGEVGAAVGATEATVESHTALPAASLGEYGLRLLLDEVLSPGLLTQTADGWGGDSYTLFTDGTGGVALGLLYVGDTETHTAEVTQAFIDLAKEVMDVDDGTRSGGGAVYTRQGRGWIFIDRESAGLVVVIASGGEAGRQLADQLVPPQ